MPIWKTYTVQSGDFISETLPVLRFFEEYNTALWFTPIDGVIGNMVGYEITAPSVGSYSVSFLELAGGDIITWTIILNVVVDAYNVFSNCCGDRNIAWFNIQGGWQNYVFSGIKTFNIDAGSEKRFKTSDYVAKYSEVGSVYDGELLSTGDIPKSHVDILDGLRAKSVQAFLYNEDTQAWDIPILIDRQSYVKYKSNDKLFEVRIKFIYAEETVIQTQ